MATVTIVVTTTAEAPITNSVHVTTVTELASMNASAQPGNGGSDRPAISAEGRYVAFSSLATNLVPGDTNNAEDIFVLDRQTHAVERVSVASSGEQADRNSFTP